MVIESGSGRVSRTVTASARVLDPSNTAHALSSHMEAQKQAMEETRRRAEEEKQRENQLSTPIPSSSNLSAPSSPSASRPTSPGRRTAEDAELSFSDSPNEDDDGDAGSTQRRRGKSNHFDFLLSHFVTDRFCFCRQSHS